MSMREARVPREADRGAVGWKSLGFLILCQHGHVPLTEEVGPRRHRQQHLSSHHSADALNSEK